MNNYRFLKVNVNLVPSAAPVLNLHLPRTLKKKIVFVKWLTRSTAAEIFATFSVAGIHHEFALCVSERFSFMAG